MEAGRTRRRATMNRFRKLFEKPNRRAFIPFWMLGDPDPDRSLLIIRALLDGGVAALELGIPFSDPIADGPTIQRAAQRALAAGGTVDRALELIDQLRRETDGPIGLLVYYNLIYQRGLDEFCRQLHDVGVDAVLAADLPIEESEGLEQALRAHDLGCVHLVAPNTPPSRAAHLIERSTAFAYVLSTFGTTGARAQLDPAIGQNIRQLRGCTKRPLVVGFGISRPAQAEALYDAGADGVIVGSALVHRVEPCFDDPPALIENIKSFVREFVGAASGRGKSNQ